MIKANDPSLVSWVEVKQGSDFPIQNLPLGVFKTEQLKPRVGMRIGEFVIDMKSLQVLGYLDNLPFAPNAFDSSSLNLLMKKGKLASRRLRDRVSDLLEKDNTELQNNEHHVNQVLIPIEQTIMLMPVEIGDYTDFYSSKEHATNVGTMFRDPNNALLPNWLWIPVGYHGRSSSVIISDQDVHRPKGQTKPNENEPPVFGPSRMIDFELEMAFITFDGKPLGESISTAEAEDYIFGMVLFNDWSARDIQKWEYVPLGPFLAKNFASSISAWIVSLDALIPFQVDTPEQDPEVLPYLAYEGKKSYDINLQVGITPNGAEEKIVCDSNFKYMYWNMAQQLAHHTVNGCNIRGGDLLGSGTISGPTPDSYGSMLELAWKGTKPIQMPDGSERKFILDGDTVTMRGYCQNDKVRIGFGEVKTKLLPAK
ncbi:MAG: fumarylacetoacetase [Flavobacteriales bacterium]|nr:fumarylacetoacetase [Flavobacteriales bacterium]MDO7612824.1 fumarylacetoacetase [Crocinitomicaceae bacterium]